MASHNAAASSVSNSSNLQDQTSTINAPTSTANQSASRGIVRQSAFVHEDTSSATAYSPDSVASQPDTSAQSSSIISNPAAAPPTRLTLRPARPSVDPAEGAPRGLRARSRPPVSGPFSQIERQQSVTRGPRRRAPVMSGRPRNARGITGRDGAKENDIETDLLSRITEVMRKAKEHQDESKRTGDAIMELEEEIKAAGHSTPDQHRKLDTLYRELMRHSEAEKKLLDDTDVINNVAVLSAMKSSDEPAPRNGTGKSRKNQNKQILESDIIDSPSTPTEGRSDVLKRVKGATQRSSSVASQNRATITKEEVPEPKVEKAGPLPVGTEVFYKLQDSDKKDADDDDGGVGQHQIIKKIYQEKKGYSYDLRDPDKEEATRSRTPGRHLAVIPTTAQVTTPIFPVNSRIYARYPETDTFYGAEVRSYSKGTYALLFDEDQNVHHVERRYVFDPAQWK